MYSNESGSWKVADFGLSKEETTKSFPKTQRKRGTVAYRAAELFELSTTGPVQYNYPVDIWALGCIAYEVFTTSQIFPDLLTQALYKRDKVFSNPVVVQALKDLGKIGDVITATLSIQVSARPSANSLLEFWNNIEDDKTFNPKNVIIKHN
jgi:serine/threonine protein kinase